ncbi:MAG: GNAT family N-acetyltransferase [Bacteroidia bacterium]|nr:GNAT family N-acetyltransferase [Bacteroidia bacterium]
MEPIQYLRDVRPGIAELSALFQAAGLSRPVAEPERIARMLENASLIFTARDGGRLAGIARSMSDFAFCTYLSDLAVHPDYQHRGIGRELIRLTREAIGPESMLLLLSVPDAMAYYPKAGFEPVQNGFIIKRVR